MSSKPPTFPWHTVAMDFCGPYPQSNRGFRYILVFTDHFTKWVELVPTRDQLALTVVREFYRNIICKHGCPLRLLSDNGPQFKAALVETLCSYFGIQKIYSSAYYPQGDGYAERQMRTMNNSLSVLSRESLRTWDEYLPGIAFAYNAMEHEATHISPFELNTGRVPRMPGEPEVCAKFVAADANKYLKRLRKVISAAYERSRACAEKYWAKMKSQYDKNRKDIKLKEGSYVLIQLTDAERAKFPIRKLAPKWSKPATIKHVLSNGVTYAVETPDGKVRKVHCSRLLPLEVQHWSSPFPDVVENSNTTREKAENMERQKEAIEEDDGVEYLITYWPTDKDVDESCQPATQTQQTTNELGSPIESMPMATPMPPTQPSAVNESLHDEGPAPAQGPDASTPLIERPSVIPVEPASAEPVNGNTTSIDAAEDYWEVRGILDQQRRGRAVYFLVDWAGGYDPTWEPRAELMRDIPVEVRRYERLQRRLNRRRENR